MGADPAPQRPRQIGRYALHDAIAAGGMATVHLGRLLGPVGFSRTVAIKRLHPQFAKDPEFVSMFLDEARLAARIQHPNVVSTLDVVALDGELFLVMDYIQGESLARLMRRLHEKGEGVPPRMAVAIMAGALQGLHAAHDATNERGEPLHLVHRDVSPQNVLLGTDGVPRVADFGVAKAAGRSHHTADGHVKGKVGYMSPEQLRGQSVDRRTDVYAAAVVLWELLAQRRLFKAENAVAAWAQINERVVEAPSTLVDGAPRGLDAVVLRGLARDPNDRYPSALEMADALEKALPPATGRELAGWVKSTAADALRARATRIAEIESASVSPPFSSEVTHDERHVDAIPIHFDDGAISSVVRAPTEGTMSQVSSLSVSARFEKARGWGGRAAAAMAVALGLVVLILVWRWPSRSPTSPAAAAHGDPAVSSIPAAAAPSPSASTPVPEAATPAVAPPAASASPPSEAPKPTSQPAPRSAGTITPTARPATWAPKRTPSATGDTKKSCTPPYTVDASGLHIPKPECLQ